ncbi:GMP/IMP nucleotidase [Cellvibrio japonicus]|nr:GMP/IMP nucleotidase [Cellvibrio japonicus]QEI11032.1 GMP/IMP nucleotidase [Cellvibrio japonicus]QEI14607.1 GMP/IMP nucleotidase [Cellvibrio japonicus]QEI18186.1 GMP/IMP nucleotidase [Cellvibrio japonicus]
MVNWNQIDTVMLDMDGTLLDLHFDNFFWLDHLPQRYATIHGLDPETANRRLTQDIHQYEGTLQWYCLDFWSRELQVDIPQLKEEVKHKIQMRPHVGEFLQRLRDHHKKVLLVTNAHPKSLNLKLGITRIDRWLDVIVSSHEFNEPKESQRFWQQLQAREDFDPERTLFIDDTARILESARRFGIKHLLGIHQPDSQISRRMEQFPAIHHFDEIMPPARQGYCTDL